MDRRLWIHHQRRRGGGGKRGRSIRTYTRVYARISVTYIIRARIHTYKCVYCDIYYICSRIHANIRARILYARVYVCIYAHV